MDSTSYLYHIQKATILQHQVYKKKKKSSSYSAKNISEIQSATTQFYNLALQSIEKAIKLSPKNPYIYYNRSYIYTLLGRKDEALKDLDKSINLHPRFAEAFYNRALIHMLNEEPDKAIPDLSTAGEIGLFKAYNLLKQVSKEIEKKEKKPQEVPSK